MNQLKFLVVDDASFIRDLLKKSLRDAYAGCEVVDVASAHKAQSALKPALGRGALRGAGRRSAARGAPGRRRHRTRK